MALAIRGVGHAFDLDGETLEVLHDIDLEVAPGDFVAILGPSGCREIDFAAVGRRPRPTARGDDPRRRRADRSAGPVARRSVPGPDAVSLADGGGQCLARPGGARPVEEPSRAH